MNSEQTIIKCTDLAVGYDGEAVLSGINLEIRRGDFLPFSGPNGSGKTTLLRTILGLLQPVRGELHHPFAKKPPGYVPQISTLDRLYPVTAREVVCMGFYPELGLWKQPTSEMQKLVDGYLERFNLSRHSSRPLDELSGGMRQKVLIARALVSGAEVLIMDEPAAGLDEQSEFDLVRLLYQLAEHDNKTVLFAQHSLEPIIGLADEVISFAAGQTKRTSLSELLQRRHIHNSRDKTDVQS